MPAVKSPTFDTFLQIRHRKSEISQERGGLIGTINNTLTGSRFFETDEVRFGW